MKKSQVTGVILTLLFGPLGLFYSSVPAALGCIVFSFAFGLITLGIGVFFIWPVFILIGVYTVSRYNKKIDLDEKRHEEILKATKAAKA
jgi:hypothetical protein